jgi:hypothetical protein
MGRGNFAPNRATGREQRAGKEGWRLVRPVHFVGHGEESDFEDGASHEVGDLQELCEAMRKVMTEEQWQLVLSDPGIQEMVGTAAGGYDDAEGTIELPEDH